MRKIVFALLAASAIGAVSTSSAEAWGGCGPGWRPTPFGCRPVHRYWGGPALFLGPGYYHRPYWHHRYYRHYW